MLANTTVAIRASGDPPTVRLCVAQTASFVLPLQLAGGAAPRPPQIPLLSFVFNPCSCHKMLIQNHSYNSLPTVMFQINFNILYKCSPVKTSLYTIFGTLLLSACLSGNNTLILLPDVHLDNATYNCPCENTSICKFNPTIFTDCP